VLTVSVLALLWFNSMSSCFLVLNVSSVCLWHISDSTAWVEMVQSETSSFMTLDLTVIKNPLQQLGMVFKQEFIVERYQACVLVESVLPHSPASAADVRQGDIIVAVDGKRITSTAQAARIIRGTGDKFTMRVERQLNFRIQPPESIYKDGQKVGSPATGTCKQPQF
jgi:membrane-associated protease RseP (regulator of RpoE activity)